jgi:ATP-binding cassette subfamily F protein 3
MPLLQVQNLDKFYGAVPVIRGAAFTIQPGEKWGLVGRNGSGKTTLIKVLTGVAEFDHGEIHWAQNSKIGYLSQDPQFDESSIYQELRVLFRALDALQAELARLQEQMAAPGLEQKRLNTLINEFHLLSERFELAGGYQIESRIQGVLRGLGFPKERWHDSVNVLSGGERTRLALARILLGSNDILFLDEPTNYLDLAAIEWLEEYLREYKGAVLLISHDRYFLDRIVTGIYELEFCSLKQYRGNYSVYRSQKSANYQTTLTAFNKQQKEINRLAKFVREADATAKRKAHSLEKRLQNMVRIAKPSPNNQPIKIEFTGHQPSSRQVLAVSDLTKGFGSKSLFKGINFRFEAGDKIGLIGPNGAGKTTLLKLIVGLETPDQGQVSLGYEVKTGYFAQLDDSSELNGTPFSQVLEVADLDNTEARTLLGHFLFRGDDVFKPVGDLSGGERRRLGLLKLMLSKTNFLILDEPTNHLDLESIEVIEEALRNFKGTVLMVSHDRYFLNQIVNRYLVLENGQLILVPAYQDYLDGQTRNQEPLPDPIVKPLNESQLQRLRNKEKQRELKRKLRLLVELEADIQHREARRKELHQVLNDPAIHADYKRSTELSRELAEVEAQLTAFYHTWEQIQEELDLGDEKN